MEANATHTTDPPDLVSYYMGLLGRSGKKGLESVGEAAPPDLSDPALDERTQRSQAELYRIVKNYLGDRQGLYEIADHVITGGSEALRVLRNGDAKKLEQQPSLLEGLEAIVRTDGSRPSFLITNGEPDPKSSPLGDWNDMLLVNAAILKRAIACVGRINTPGTLFGFEGTGFLIAPDVVVTNRHVLQAIADKQADGSWTFRPHVNIDFGFEFRTAYNNTRTFKEVIFYGKKPITSIDHSKLDMVLLQLHPAQDDQLQPAIFSIDIAPDWAAAGQYIFTIGYPANPGPAGYAPSLLEQLFQSTYGCKRLAPGSVIPSQSATGPWTVAHDATTLGGNSGSVIVVMGREMNAAGIHYGGRGSDPKENWGHIFGRTLEETHPVSGITLRETLTAAGVKLKDRLIT